MALRQMATFDTLLELKDAGAITSDAAAQVGGSAKVIDLGAHDMRGIVYLSITAITVSAADELYSLSFQGSNVADMASGIVELAVLNAGDATNILASADVVVGEYIIPFVNVQAGVTYRYVRMFTDVTGASPSINYIARLGKEL